MSGQPRLRARETPAECPPSRMRELSQGSARISGDLEEDRTRIPASRHPVALPFEEVLVVLGEALRFRDSFEIFRRLLTVASGTNRSKPIGIIGVVTGFPKREGRAVVKHEGPEIRRVPQSAHRPSCRSTISARTRPGIERRSARGKGPMRCMGLCLRSV